MLSPTPARRYVSAGKLRTTLEDISKADPVYRRYGYIQIGIAAGWLVCVIASALCIYYGSWKNTVESWQKSYQELYIAADNHAEAEILAAGTEILSSVTYRSYLERNPDKKAEVLDIVGESYYRQEQYGEAAAYYREAWELEPEESSYCENYVIALIHNGQYERARSIAESTDGIKVLSQEKRDLITLELAWMYGETENAETELEQLVGSLVNTGDTRTAVNAYRLLADIYTEDGAYAEAVAALENALQLTTDREVQRQLGETAYLAANASDREVYRNIYLLKALESYETLNQSRSPSYEDRLNLALVQRSLGQYEDSNVTLRDMLVSYPNEYVVPMWMCYNYLDLANESGDYQGVISDLRFRYQDSRHIYDANGVQDENMEQLKEIMKSLGE